MKKANVHIPVPLTPYTVVDAIPNFRDRWKEFKKQNFPRMLKTGEVLRLDIPVEELPSARTSLTENNRAFLPDWHDAIAVQRDWKLYVTIGKWSPQDRRFVPLYELRQRQK